MRSGGRTRTLNDWTRTSSVADYTTPEGGSDTLPSRRHGSHVPSARWVVGRDRRLDLVLDVVVDVDEPPVADDPADRHRPGLLDVAAQAATLVARRHRGVEAQLAGDLPGPEGVVAAGDEHGPAHVAVAQDASGGPQRLPRVLALVLPQDVRVGHAVAHEVVGAGAGLGAAVARPLAPRHHDAAGQAAVVEVEGVVEPLLQHRGGPAVVLGRAQHDDGVGVAGAVAPAGPHHLGERDRHVTDQQQCGQRHTAPQPAPAPPRLGAGVRLSGVGPAEDRRHSRARAARRRASVRSRPSTTNDSYNGGPTLRPVTATRTGAWALAICTLPSGFTKPVATPASDSARSMASRSQSHASSPAMAASSIVAPRSPSFTAPFCHASSSILISSSRRKSIIGSTSPSVRTRSRTSSAMGVSTTSLASPWTRYGRARSTKAGASSARMYSALTCDSLRRSK